MVELVSKCNRVSFSIHYLMIFTDFVKPGFESFCEYMYWELSSVYQGDHNFGHVWCVLISNKKTFLLVSIDNFIHRFFSNLINMLFMLSKYKGNIDCDHQNKRYPVFSIVVN